MIWTSTISKCPNHEEDGANFGDLLRKVKLHTGCPVNWYSHSISISDFSDCPIKKIVFAILTQMV